MSNLSDRNKKTIFVSAEQSPDKAGLMKETAEDAIPDGWLECNGQVVLRADYPDLFAAIGTTYNTGGELGTEFRLPPNERVGKTDGIAVSAGQVGEVIEQEAIITITVINDYLEVDSIELTAGEWEVSGSLMSLPSGSPNAFLATLYDVSGSEAGATLPKEKQLIGTSGGATLSWPPQRVSIAAGTTDFYYMNGYQNGGATGGTFRSYLRAVRIA